MSNQAFYLLSQPSPRGASLLALLSVALLFVFPVRGRAQASDQVHIVPGKQAAPRTIPADASLTVHSKPFRADVDLVLVPVTVTDTMNRPVVGLTKTDFSLYEDGNPQQIRSFWCDDSPISVGVLLDLSKSMSNKLDVAREALGKFFALGNPEDDYFVITFADRPALLADASESIGTIQARLANAAAGGHTALLDAIYLGENELQQARYKRRALLIISDGGDNRSRFTTRELKSMVEEEDVTVYAIGLFDKVFKSPEEWAGKRLLTQITEATGGRTVTLNNPKDLPQAASEISIEMRNQYILGYRPSNAARDGKWRKIKVRVSPPAQTTQLQVYSKSGYRAPEE
ncbi:MAG: VWA domain-containing protein [Chlamydiota bacterium]